MPMRKVAVNDLARAGITDELNVVLAKHGMILLTEQNMGPGIMWVEYVIPKKAGGERVSRGYLEEED